MFYNKHHLSFEFMFYNIKKVETEIGKIFYLSDSLLS